MTRLWSAIVVLLALAPVAGARTPPPEPAVPSELAAGSLLLDVARAGSRLVAVGHRGHVVLSDDDGRSWRQASSVPVRTTLTAVFFIDEKQGWVVGHDAVILYSDDGGNNWHIQHRDPALETPLFSLWFSGPRHGLAVGAYGLAFRTRDGGKNWERFTVSEDEDLHLNRLFPAPDGTLLIAAEQGTVYRSRDRGKTWKTLTTTSPGSFWGGLALRDGSILAFGLRGHLYRSDDGGDNWSALDTQTELSLTGAIERENGVVVITGLGGTLLYSEDKGRTFHVHSLPGLRNYSAITADSGGALLLFSDKGVERIESDGKTPWSASRRLPSWMKSKQFSSSLAKSG